MGVCVGDRVRGYGYLILVLVLEGEWGVGGFLGSGSRCSISSLCPPWPSLPVASLSSLPNIPSTPS